MDALTSMKKTILISGRKVLCRALNKRREILRIGDHVMCCASDRLNFTLKKGDSGVGKKASFFNGDCYRPISKPHPKKRQPRTAKGKAKPEFKPVHAYGFARNGRLAPAAYATWVKAKMGADIHGGACTVIRVRITPQGEGEGEEEQVKSYVAGFMFRFIVGKPLEVALVRKDKGGQFQVGRLNGIGGKIEEGEQPINAMIREFREETGHETTDEDWRHYCQLGGDAWTVHFFVCLTGSGRELKTMESEEIGWHSVESPYLFADCVSNLKWLIPLALDKDEVSAQVRDYSTF
jgi:8-oxo-dGTP diphosphatase